jgi:hypothetical protein
MGSKEVQDAVDDFESGAFNHSATLPRPSLRKGVLRCVLSKHIVLAPASGASLFKSTVLKNVESETDAWSYH